MIVEKKDTEMGSAGNDLGLLGFISVQILDTNTLLKLTCSGGDCT